MKRGGSMKPLFKQEMVKWLWMILIVLFVVKILWSILEVWVLPTIDINYVPNKGGKALYYRVKLSPNMAEAPKIKNKISQNARKVKGIKLLAIYHASDTTVVTVEYERKTKVLGRGEVINGFVLEGAGRYHATFSKNEKMYKILLQIKGKGKESIQVVKPPKSSKDSSGEVEGEIIDVGGHKIIDKSLISYYAKNLGDIQKNIGIREVKKGNKIEGFGVTFIKRGSLFSQLGLKRGDMIKSINGQELDSYQTAFAMYKNIENIENLTMVIKRGKKEMELEYEVN